MNVISNAVEFRPNWATHPGDHLREYLDIHDMSAGALAHVTGLPVSYVENVLARRERVNELAAQKLESAFGLKAYIWLGLQRGYDEHKSRRRR